MVILQLRSFARIRCARDFLMCEGIFPFDGINIPEFQRELDAWGYLNIRNSNGERYISCNGINDLTELCANVLSSPNIQRLCNNMKQFPRVKNINAKFNPTFYSYFNLLQQFHTCIFLHVHCWTRENVIYSKHKYSHFLKKV